MIPFAESLAVGYGCLAAWSDLLDNINVFPVADGDTGANLRISLAPFRDPAADRETTLARIARSATGNSGNIAASFFLEFCRAEDFSDLPAAAALGRKKAWKAVAQPCVGTILTFFDSLAESLAQHGLGNDCYPKLCRQLQQAVVETSDLLPDLKRAGVVDSGALGMFLFFDGFLHHCTRQKGPAASLYSLFPRTLDINPTFHPITNTATYCVDAIIQPEGEPLAAGKHLAKLGESVVIVPEASHLKIHIHTQDPVQLKSQLNHLGKVVAWSGEPIEEKAPQPSIVPKKRPIHIMTDAAGSLTRRLAREQGLTLLDSYIVTEEEARPETLCKAEQIYPRMRRGKKVTTAQASLFERQQQYQSVTSQFGPTLYLCTGSAFTGNYHAATRWQNEHDPKGLCKVMDTGAASGRLALIALLTARYADQAERCEDVVTFARKVCGECLEYVFIDTLKYLVTGGRITRTGAFWGDLLKMKPVVTPTQTGVQKLAVLHSRRGQFNFALEKLRKIAQQNTDPIILLQYTDNKKWVEERVQPQVKKLLPGAETLLLPLSLTSGVHMGPGAWSLAWAPVHGKDS